MIEIRNVRKTYHMGSTQVHALRDVSLTIEPGEFVAIMGPSGSGKSSLMNILGLLDVPDRGSYLLEGKEVALLSEDDLAVLRRDSIGFVFQQFNLLKRTTALDNVALPLLYSKKTTSSERAEQLLKIVGLGARIDHKPNELSGGQQQRVAIARALINEPRIILADEPTGNLDSASEKEIMSLLSELNRQGMTIILVTHEEEIAHYASRVIRMRDGQIQSDVKSSAVNAQPQAVPQLSAVQPIDQIRSLQLIGRELWDHARQGLRALGANKVRAALSMLGILIGVAAVIAMLAIGRGAAENIEKQLSSMGSNLLILKPGVMRTSAAVGEAGSMTRMNFTDVNELQVSFEGIKRLSPEVAGRGQVIFGSRNWNSAIKGVGAHYGDMHASNPVIGRFFTEDEERKRLRVAVLGMSVVREIFGDQNPLGETIKLNKINFQVIGVLPEKGTNGSRDQDDVVLIPVRTAMYRLLGRQYLDMIEMEIKDPKMMDVLHPQIISFMNRRHRIPASSIEEAFQVRNMAEVQAALFESNRTMSLLLFCIAAISLVVGGIGIMNIMLVSVTERTREIGLRKALGARRWDILSQFLVEASVVSVSGGLAGIALGYAVTGALTYLADWPTSVSPFAVALSFVFSGLIGIVFGIWPARKASQLNPIQALRYE